MLGLEPVAHAGGPGHIEQLLGSADCVRRAAGHLPREGEGVVERLLREARGQTEFRGLDAADHTSGEGELLGDVGAHEVPQQLGAGHVGNEAPDDFAHGESRLRVDDPQVGAEGDLEAAAVGHAMDCGDHRYRHRVPDPGRGLAAVGRVVVRSCQELIGQRVAARTALHGLEAAEVEAGAEGATVAGENDGAHGRVGGQLAAGRAQRVEHRAVQRIQLVGPVETDIGDAVCDLDGDAGAGGYLGHGALRVLVGVRRGADRVRRFEAGLRLSKERERTAAGRSERRSAPGAATSRSSGVCFNATRGQGI